MRSPDVRILGALFLSLLLATGVEGQVLYGYVSGTLDAACVECHGTMLAENGLRLDSWDALARGSDPR